MALYTSAIFTQSFMEYYRVLKPHSSLGKKGQARVVWSILLLVMAKFIAVFIALILIENYNSALIASAERFLFIFFLLPALFMFAAFWAVNYQMKRHEILKINDQQLYLTHVEPNGRKHEFKTVPHWVQVKMSDKGPVPNYVTLSSQNRTVELGRFLSPEERKHLFQEVVAFQRSLLNSK